MLDSLAHTQVFLKTTKLYKIPNKTMHILIPKGH
jgi:hypothetical protein